MGEDPVRDLFGEPISVYTREQAIEDGTLVHVKTLGRGSEAVTVCFTSHLYADLEEPERDALLLEGCKALTKPDAEDSSTMKLRVLRGSYWAILDGDGLTFMYPEDY